MISERIVIARKRQKLKQVDLAARLGVSIDTVRRWEQGKRPPNAEMLAKIAGVLGTTTAFLLEDDGIGLPASNVHAIDVIAVPVVGNVRACCGRGNAYPEDVQWEEVGTYPVPATSLMGYSWQVGTDGFRALRVEGNSMEPRIWDGDIILFAQLEVRTGDIALVQYEDRLLVRGVFREGENRLRLHPLNPAYDDISVDLSDDGPDFVILGRVLLRLPRAENLAGGIL